MKAITNYSMNTNVQKPFYQFPLNLSAEWHFISLLHRLSDFVFFFLLMYVFLIYSSHPSCKLEYSFDYVTKNFRLFGVFRSGAFRNSCGSDSERKIISWNSHKALLGVVKRKKIGNSSFSQKTPIRLRKNDGLVLFCSFYLQYVKSIFIHLPIKDFKAAIGIKIYCTKRDTQGTGPIFCRRLSSPPSHTFWNQIFPSLLK